MAQARDVARALAEVTVVDPACGSGAYLLGIMQELIELQARLFNVTQDAKSLYELKLEIIQRNLYGVDIDSFAVNIAMLRMWLSLAIDYEGATPEPLPNLDFKVVCGDSLLGPDPSSGAEVQVALGQDIELVRRLGDLKAEYLRASSGADKDRLRTEIETLNATFRNSLNLADTEGVVNWRVEFAEVFSSSRGFDIAIANPPYVQLQKDAGRLGKLYQGCGYDVFTKTGDIYQLFYERGCQVLRPTQGILAYITSNSWLKAEYGKPLRRYFTEKHSPLLLLELGKDVFESAIVDSGVLMLCTGGAAQPFPAVDMDRVESSEVPPPAELWGQARPDGEAPWSVMSLTEHGILYKMRTKGTPLKDWDVKINYGIKTGYNRAFIIDNSTRAKLVESDAKSAKIIKPVLRGKDIQRFRSKWAGQWLIDTHNRYGDVAAVDADSFPSVKTHLNNFFSSLEKRGDKGRTPYNLRDCAYYEDFSQEKLLWIELVDRGRFTYDNSGIFCANTAYILSGNSIKYLCAVLNSTLTTWFMNSTALTSGMGATRWIKSFVETIPTPKLTAAKQRPFVRLVDSILEAKAADSDADTSELELKIDRMVYDLYGLTEEEKPPSGRAWA